MPLLRHDFSNELWSMRILVSGAHGFLGTPLVLSLESLGHEIIFLVRKEENGKRKVIVWHPETGEVDPSFFEGIEAVIHLAGKNLAEKRWSKEFKQELFQSRCRDTWLLAQALSRISRPPKVFIGASAMGFYGNTGEVVVDELKPPGRGFLADLCVQWEKASAVLRQSGCRVVHVRFGALLHPSGGLMAKMEKPFRWGFGAILGDGQQWMSWISREDAIRAIEYILFETSLEGPVNLCTEHPIRNQEWTETLARLHHTKVRGRIPKFLLPIFFGEMATEMMLSSTRAVPDRLKKSGFIFKTPTISQIIL